jgi:hypothetical protein
MPIPALIGSISQESIPQEGPPTRHLSRPTSVEKLKAWNLGDLIFILFNRGSYFNLFINFLLILKGKEILVSFNDTPPHRVYVILRGSRGNLTRITNDNQNIHE